MRRSVRTCLAVGVAAATAITTAAIPAAAAPTPSRGLLDGALAPVQDFLKGELSDLVSGERTTVLVHGTDLAAANRAVKVAGLTKTMSFDKIGVVVARGTKAQIAAARAVPGVTYLEGNAPIELARTPRPAATRRTAR